MLSTVACSGEFGWKSADFGDSNILILGNKSSSADSIIASVFVLEQLIINVIPKTGLINIHVHK